MRKDAKATAANGGVASTSPSSRLRLRSLTPQYSAKEHATYLAALNDAVTDLSIRNVAITGGYGSGKSSVLRRFAEVHGDKVIEISVSATFPSDDGANRSGAASADDPSAPAGKTQKSRTNKIQKEIVKQLLYRLPPTSVPNSRFRRAYVPDAKRERKIAAFGGLGAFVALMALGLLQLPVENLLEETWRQVLAYIAIAAAAVMAVWAGRALVHRRFALAASVKAGPATLSLEKNSDSYFDQYLDEIVYFFEASGCEIVVIEDIDRFKDVQVFDTLRALNRLLNSSDQVGKRILFVYAIRDSVFDELGRLTDHVDAVPDARQDEADRAKATLERASRTKFFDLIIPVVPFVSADNARDLMTSAMQSDTFVISPALIRLAGRHVADMRTIHNIRNEFEIYRSSLIQTDSKVPGIDDDRVFAVVLYKNTHLADFERIRHADSRLDRLYELWRKMVRDNLDSRNVALGKLRTQTQLAAAELQRAEDLGERLETLRHNLEGASPQAPYPTSADLIQPVTAATIGDPQAWAQIANGEAQVIRLQNQRFGAIDMTFDAAELTSFLGADVTAAARASRAHKQTLAAIASAEADADFLRHHTWEELCRRPDFTVDATAVGITGAKIDKSDGAGATFEQLVDGLLQSELARDLVKRGYLTSHYALYTSTYYGTHAGPEALEYIHRAIEPGVPDFTFAMTAEQVKQVLREQGADRDDAAALFSDSSVLNVSVLDHLLESRPDAARIVATRLAAPGKLELDFIDTYAVQGAKAASLFAVLSPLWLGALSHLVKSEKLGDVRRRELVDAVLSAHPHGRFMVDSDVSEYFASNYQHLEQVCHPESPKRASIVMSLVEASGATLSSITPLSASAREAAIDVDVIPLTEANLRALYPAGAITLEMLREQPSVYQYVLRHFGDYLALARRSTTFHAVRDPEAFTDVLRDAAEVAEPQLLTALVQLSDSRCRVEVLRDVDSSLWPVLCDEQRTPAEYGNLDAYLSELGWDAHIAHLLAKARKVAGASSHDEDVRRQHAVTIINGGKHITSTLVRASLAASLVPGELDPADLEPEASDIVARLLRKGLLPDSSGTFDDRLMVDWSTFERALAASKKFASFADSATPAPRHIADLIASPKVTNDIKLAVIRQLDESLKRATRSQANNIALALANGGWKLPLPYLQAARVAGVNAQTLIRLAAAAGGVLSLVELRALLTAIGGDYADLARGGGRRPSFKADAYHEAVLGRLSGVTVKWIKTRKFPRKGTVLVAQLL